MPMKSKFLLKAEKLPQMHATTIDGIDLVIEWPVGSTRTGVDKEGNPWKRFMKNSYGYLRDAKTVDDHEDLDCYLGDDEGAEYAYIVEQLDDDGNRDEFKSLLFFPDLESARDAYLSNMPIDWESTGHVGEIREMPFDELVAMVQDNQGEPATKSGEHLSLEELRQKGKEASFNSPMYHGTSRMNLPHIAREGLTPTEPDGIWDEYNHEDEDEEGESHEPDYEATEPRLFASPYLRVAKDYAAGYRYDKVILRLPADMNWQEGATNEEYVYTIETVPPDRIDVLQEDGTWTPLKKMKLATQDPSGAECGLRNRPDYLADDSYCKKMNDANEKTASADMFGKWWVSPTGEFIPAKGNVGGRFEGRNIHDAEALGFKDKGKFPTKGWVSAEDAALAAGYARVVIEPDIAYLQFGDKSQVEKMAGEIIRRVPVTVPKVEVEWSTPSHGYQRYASLADAEERFQGYGDTSRVMAAKESKSKMCTCGHPFDIHTHPPDFGCPHEKDGCGCVGATEVGEKTASVSVPGYPPSLNGLAAEARKCPTFKDFYHDFSIEIKHGRYYHLTENPEFQIDSTKGPRDMSSMGGGGMTPGALMVTSHLDNWDGYYNYDENEKRQVTRPYVAIIDMSEVPRKAYYQSKRSFGNEFYCSDPAKARVTRVVSIDNAHADDRRYRTVLEKYINSDAQLEAFYNAVKKANPDIPKDAPIKPAKKGITNGDVGLEMFGKPWNELSDEEQEAVLDKVREGKTASYLLESDVRAIGRGEKTPAEVMNGGVLGFRNEDGSHTSLVDWVKKEPQSPWEIFAKVQAKFATKRIK